jgi:magnesium transporter
VQVEATLLLSDGSTKAADAAAVTEALASKKPFWLDLVDLEAEGLSWLTNIFHFHPLAIEDAEHFGQRPKLDEYDDFAQLVLYGAADNTVDSVEVHALYSVDYVVTVRRGGCKVIEDLRQQAVAWRHHAPASSVMLLYRIADALVDSYFPVMSSFDDQIDELEEAILKQPTDAQLGTLFAMKRQLVSLRKLVTPERDMMAALLAGADDLPGMTDDTERYFRDLYDHLIRLSDLVDSYRDLLTSAVDTHLSTVSNRLNIVMKQLTIIATIFLPLSFLTGFFGQNFAWLVVHITGWWQFLIFGIGLEAAAVVILLRMFRQRGWIGGGAEQSS